MLILFPPHLSNNNPLVERGNHLVVYPAQLELFLSENDHLTVSAIDIDSESDSEFFRSRALSMRDSWCHHHIMKRFIDSQDKLF